jgi:N-acetylglucosaminyldiphosphoundecaprenol N-acetyl-beta-D-mannosaminyltransferase
MEVDPSRYRLLDVEVDALTLRDLNALVETAIKGGEQRIIANHNLHSIYLYHRTPKMRQLYRRADHVHIDGMSLVFLGRLLGLPLKKAHRVTYVDWIRPLLRTVASGQWKLFYLGARPEVVATGAERIREAYPDLELKYHHGYFDRSPDGEENQSVVTTINAFQPDVLMVGMGMPRQEKWILDNIDRIEAHVILPAGGCIDYVAGATPTPPRWMGRLGLEWLYRFLQEPDRLWRRNFVEPWPLLLRFLKDLVRRRLF